LEPYVVPLNKLGLADIDTVGGKNASLGEMITNLSHAGVNVPGGFATTADAYRKFLQHEGLAGRIDELLQKLDVDNIPQLTSAGSQIREWMLAVPLPDQVRTQIISAWENMSEGKDNSFSVAVRSSATAEDLPDASFAGQQETLLNVRGLDQLLTAVVQIYASLYTDRAIAYRVHQGFNHHDVAYRLAYNEWSVATWLPAASCLRWTRNQDFVTWCSLPLPGVLANASFRAQLIPMSSTFTNPRSGPTSAPSSDATWAVRQ